MDDLAFDTALVTAAFALGAEAGWESVSAATAAQSAGLDLVRARTRFGATGCILHKFNELADRYALTGALDEGSVRDRLFDTIMRRFDFLQTHRAGTLALLRALPFHAPLALAMAHATVNSMGWLLAAAGAPSTGLRGEVTKRALAVVWAIGVRAWAEDETADLTTTMAAIDTALNRAEALAERLMPAPAAPSDDAPFTPPAEPPSPEDPARVD